MYFTFRDIYIIVYARVCVLFVCVCVCVCVCIVDALRKDCKYVELSLIPRPVISLFQQLKRRKHPIPQNQPSTEIDWSRIEPKLSSTLMQFQREGVEYVNT